MGEEQQNTQQSPFSANLGGHFSSDREQDKIKQEIIINVIDNKLM